VISHALTIRELQRQELLVDADRERLIDQHCPPAPFGAGHLPHRLGQLFRRTLTATRSPRTVLPVATQS
jgi:hypothetical protein